MQISYPEIWGAVGDGVHDDTDAFVAMGDDARRLGYLRAVFSPGRTYTTTNPFFLEGIRDIVVEGNYSSLMNIRSTYSDVKEMFPLVTPALVESGGHTLPQVWAPNYGDLITSANIGDVAVNTLSTPTNLFAGARAVIYGCNAMRGDTFPPAPRIFEFVIVKNVGGNVVELETPLQNFYDDRWPDGLGGLQNKGAPRILSLDRGAAFTLPQRFEVHRIKFKPNPNWSLSDPLNNAERNGRPQFYGGWNGLLNECETPAGLYISSFKNLKIVGCRVGGQIEIDKMQENVDIIDTHAKLIGGALGTKRVRLIRCNGTLQLPTSQESLYVEECEFDDVAFSPTAPYVASQPSSGSNRVEIRSTKFAATGSGRKSITSLYAASVRVYSVVNATTFNLGTQLQYETPVTVYSSIVEVIRLGSVLYSQENAPVMKVTKLPYMVNGEIFVEGVVYAQPTPNDVLLLPHIKSFILDGVSFKGPYAQGLLAYENFGQPMLTEVRQNNVEAA